MMSQFSLNMSLAQEGKPRQEFTDLNLNYEQRLTFVPAGIDSKLSVMSLSGRFVSLWFQNTLFLL